MGQFNPKLLRQILQLNPEKLAQLPISTGLLRLRNIQIAPEGLLLIINGNPQLNVQRVVSPDRLIVDMQVNLSTARTARSINST